MGKGEISMKERPTVDTSNLGATVLRRISDYDNPFAAFDDRRADWVAQGIHPDLMVRAAQFTSGIALNTEGLGNLYGWAREEVERHQRTEGEQ